MVMNSAGPNRNLFFQVPVYRSTQFGIATGHVPNSQVNSTMTIRDVAARRCAAVRLDDRLRPSRLGARSLKCRHGRLPAQSDSLYGDM